MQSFHRPNLYWLGCLTIVVISALMTGCTKKETAIKADEELPPLHQAAMDGDLEKVKALLATGHDVNEQTSSVCKYGGGDTAIVFAAARGNTDIIDVLLEEGARLDGYNEMGYSPLHSVANDGDPKGFRKLLDAAENINIPTIAPSPDIEFSIEGEKAEADMRLGMIGKTIAHLAACNDDVSNLKLAIEYGTDLNAKDGAGSTPLHGACMFQRSEHIELLLDAGADIKATSDGENSVLHWMVSWDLYSQASMEEKERCVKLLLDAGADLKAMNNKGRTAWEMAREEGRDDLAKLLKPLE